MSRLITALAIFGSCSIIFGCGLKQEWSENYALTPGVISTSPQMIDGNLQTIGETTSSVSVQGFGGRGGPSSSEVVITLPDKKMIRRLVVHSDNLMTFNVYANKEGTADNPDWRLVKEVKSVKKSPIDVSMSMSFSTDQIRLIALRIVNDSDTPRQRRGGFGRGGGFGGGNRGASAQISEIELYGYSTGEESKAENQEKTDDQMLKDLLQ